MMYKICINLIIGIKRYFAIFLTYFPRYFLIFSLLSLSISIIIIIHNKLFFARETINYNKSFHENFIFYLKLHVVIKRFRRIIKKSNIFSHTYFFCGRYLLNISPPIKGNLMCFCCYFSMAFFNNFLIIFGEDSNNYTESRIMLSHT